MEVMRSLVSFLGGAVSVALVVGVLAAAGVIDDDPATVTTTEAPSLASSLATDLPMPRPAPVTIATRPSRRAMPAPLPGCRLLESSSGISL